MLKISVDVSADIYFLLGALEDGYLGCREVKGEHVVEFYQKNRRWLHGEVAKRLKRLGFNPKIRRYKRDYYRIVVYSKDLYTVLSDARKRLYMLLNGSSLEDERVLNYIQGLFDSDGAVHKKLARITLWSKDEKKLKVVKQILERAGMKCGKLIRSRHVYGLPLYGKANILVFAEKIGFRHPVKKARLAGKGALAQP